MNPEVLQKIRKARAQLMLTQPFFGYLACMLEPRAEKIGTFATDGKHLFIDEKFACDLSIENTQFIFAHEVLHVALDHLTRRNAREPQAWNLAIDYATNDMLVNEGFTMPDGKHAGLYDQCFHQKSAEQIYEELLKSGKIKYVQFDLHLFSDGTAQEKEEALNKLGQSLELDKDAIKELKDAVIMAAQVAKKQGKCPAAIEELIKELVKPKINWRKVLARFLINNIAMNDFSFTRLKRQYMAKGMAIPTLRSPEPPPVGVAIDTSGSISDENLKQFISELQSFARIGWNFDTHIFINDADLHWYKKIPARKIRYNDIKIIGRGGTDFCPVFNKIKDDRIKISCLVFLTDCEGTFPDKKPDYPVLWVKPNKSDAGAPFGQVVTMEN